MQNFVRLLLIFGPLAGQAGAQSELQKEAASAWAARDWSRAETAYQALAQADTTVPMPHMRRGFALIALGRYDEARLEVESSARRGAPPPQVALLLGIIDAGKGRLDSAFSQLKRATIVGLAAIPVPGDSLPPMQKLKTDSRYAAFLTDLDRNARPCMYDERHKQFDFWVGVWDVRPKGQPNNPPARNEVTKIDDGCVVHESWTAPASVGQSFNIFDRTRDKWFQIWVDNSGGLHEYSGSYSDNAMRYEGTTPALPPATGRVRTRLTFFRIAADTVRQFSESLGADGKWTTNYDLIYSRAAKKN